jgi:TatD DNase family protein
LEKAIEKGCYFSVNGAMIKSKRFLEFLPMIPSSRILIETDSPFTSYTGSYNEHLQSIKTEIQAYKPDADVWTNFRRLLGGNF